MTELERVLVLLGDDLDVPPAPPLASSVRDRIRRRRRARRLVAIAVPVAALAVAFAVPQARSAILRFFDIGAVKVERVQTLPPAVNGPAIVGLGRARPRAVAERIAGFRAHLGSVPAPSVWYARGGLLATRVRGVFLVELSGGQLGVIKKFVTGNVSPEEVNGSFAIWIGSRHVLSYVEPNGELVKMSRSVRTALVWERNGVTYRLEDEPNVAAALRDAKRITP